MPRSEIVLAINKHHFLENGARVTFAYTEPVRARPGKTADHEARHVKAARKGIQSATIVPGEGYNGLTVLTEPDPVAAAAPDAFGCDGTGWDMHLVEALGHNPESMRSAARGRLVGEEDEILEIATTLEEKKTITQSDVDECHRRVIRKRAGIKDVTVIVIDANGEEVKNKLIKTKNGIAMIPGEWVDLPHAA